MFHLRKLLKNIGPGVITGAADDDPSGVVTYSQTGARFGYQFLWLALFTAPMMMAVQEMSARIGLVTRQGLGKIIRQHVSRRTSFILAVGLLIVNTINISADLNALAAVTKLILPGSAVWYVFGFAFVILLLEIRLTYQRYANILKWLTVTLLSYVIVAVVVKQDWGAIAWHTFIPHFGGGTQVWYLLTAILGTTISPYLFYWQASEEVEEAHLWDRVKEKFRLTLPAHLRSMRRDTVTGMLYSNVVMFFIILATTATLHNAGITNITTAAEAASALKPLAGSFAFMLFALGMIGTGLLAIPVLAGSAAYALAEVFDWPEGLGETFRQAKAFYVTIGVAILGGAFACIIGTNPITFLILAAVLNGLLAPFILFHIVRLASNKNVVGEHVSPPLVRIGGWVTMVLMSVTGALTLFQLFTS